MIHNILNIKAAVTYVPYQDLENKFLLKGLLDSPDQFLKHIRRFTYSLSTQMIFGYRCVDFYDPKLQQLFTVSRMQPSMTWPQCSDIDCRTSNAGARFREAPAHNWQTCTPFCRSCQNRLRRMCGTHERISRKSKSTTSAIGCVQSRL